MGCTKKVLEKTAVRGEKVSGHADLFWGHFSGLTEKETQMKRLSVKFGRIFNVAGFFEFVLVSKPDVRARCYLVFLSLAALDPIPGWWRSSGMSPLRSFFPRQKNMR